MIYTNLNNDVEISNLGEKIRACIEFVKNNDVLNTYEPGVYYLENPKVRMNYDNVYTKAESEGFWESHLKHIDVQIFLEGKEYVGISSIKKLKEKSRDVEKDLIVYDGEKEFRLEFKPNDVLVLFPEDGHMPGITIGENSTLSKKIVFKVEI